MKKTVSTLCAALTLCLCLSPRALAESAAVVTGSEEVIYVTLDASGALESAYAVVAMDVTSPGTVRSHGVFAAVKNLTDASPITYKNGLVTAEAGKGRFYYQGELAAVQLPWLISVTYTLDGAQISASELGGKSGRVGVSIKTAKNERADVSYYDNFLLQVSVTLDTAICTEIDAGSGTAANAGGNKQITFAVLPGSDADLHLEATVSNFSMAGISLAAVPYSAAALGSASELTDGLGQLTDAVSALSDGAAELSNGAAQVTYGAKNFGQGLLAVADGSPALISASQQIQTALETISGGLSGSADSAPDLSSLAQLPPALTQLSDALDQISGGMGQLSSGYSQAYLAMSTLMSVIPGPTLGETELLQLKLDNPTNTTIDTLIGAYAAEQLIKTTWETVLPAFEAVNTNLPTLQDSINQVSGGLKTMSAQIQGSLTGDAGDMSQLISGMAELASQYAEFNTALTTYATGVQTLGDNWYSLEYGVSRLSGGAGELAEGAGQLDGATSELPENVGVLTGDSDYVSHSFLSEENANTVSVQFVFTTAGIEPPVLIDDEVPAEAETGVMERIWNKLTALFVPG